MRADTLRTTVRTPAGEVGIHVWPARGMASNRAGDDDAAVTARRPVLVALHGWTDGGADFGPLVAQLGDRWTVVAIDAPGHGRTPWPQGRDPGTAYAVPQAAEQVAAVIDALPRVGGRQARVVLLGHSMGAVSAAAAAALRPRAVVHVVLEDPARTTARAIRNPARRRQHLARLQAMSPQQREALSRNENPQWPAEVHPVWAATKAEVDPAHLRVPIEWGEPLVALLADVTVPVTLIHGRRDRGAIVSATAARRCAAACRAGCDVVQLYAGHSLRRDAPGPFVAVLAAVLGRYER